MMNTMYQEAGKANCATFCEGAMACMTAYLIHFCSETVRKFTLPFIYFLWSYSSPKYRCAFFIIFTITAL